MSKVDKICTTECAAPELLEALENIIEAYKQGYEIVPNILAVRNAIAKAKGENDE